MADDAHYSDLATAKRKYDDSTIPPGFSAPIIPKFENLEYDPNHNKAFTSAPTDADYEHNPNVAQQSDESSEETQLNEDSDESPEAIVALPSRTSTRKKAKPWNDKEEEALAKAWIDVSGDPECADSFWKRMLDNFGSQLGDTDRTVHQLNSKWKDMNGKIIKFNALYKNKCGSGKSEVDALSATMIEYRELYKNKAFPHQTAWEVVKDNPKWNAVFVTCTHVISPKRVKTKTSDSNTCTTSSDTQFPNNLVEEGEGVRYEEAERPQQKEVKLTSSASLEQQQLIKIISELNSFNKEDVEDKKRHRAEKLRLKKEEKEKKMLILEQELRMMRQKEMDKDMQFFLMPHDNLTGAALNAVLTRKREIAQRWGWE